MARIAGVNIPTNKIVQIGLTYIYGIGDRHSKKICQDLDIPKSNRLACTPFRAIFYFLPIFSPFFSPFKFFFANLTNFWGKI